VSVQRWAIVGAAGVSAILACALTPALGAPSNSQPVKARITLAPRGSLGAFTPASADPRLAAVLARNGLGTSGFRFTPATASVRLSRSVTVAVRAQTSDRSRGDARSALVGPTATTIAPIAYNLGAAVGWRRFAVSGDVAKVDLGALGGREAVDVGVSFTTRKFTTRIAAGAERALPGTPRALALGANAYSVDVAGAYRLNRNLDLTAGVRLRRAERDRLAPLADDRRDSQAVYIGTAFKF